MADGQTHQPTGLERFASSAGKAGISFLTQTPQIELDRQEAENNLISLRAEGMKQDIEQAKVASQEKLQLQNLSRVAFGGGPDADAALNEIFARDPTQADKLFEGLGALDQASREEASRDAFTIQSLPFPQRRPAILERAARIEAQGRDATQTLSLLDMDEDTQTNQLRIIQSAALSTKDRAVASRGGDVPAEQRVFQAQTKKMNELSAIPEAQRTQAEKDTLEAVRVDLGLAARKVGSAAITTATTEDLTEQVAESEATIKQRVKFAELTGSSRAKAIDKGFETVQRLDKNTRTLNKAITSLKGGAETGPIISRLTPSVRASSVELEQIQNELALDVVSANKFGALSAGELDLSKVTAIPTNLSPPELIDWLERKIVANNKLRDYFNKQIQWLDGGGTVAGFLRQQESQVDQSNKIGRFTVEQVN